MLGVLLDVRNKMEAPQRWWSLAQKTLNSDPLIVMAVKDPPRTADATTSELQPVQILNHFLHAGDHERETIVIKFVGCVTGGVIVRITKRCRVRDPTVPKA